MLSQDVGDQDAFIHLWQGGHIDKEPGVRKEWKKIICLKEDNGKAAKMNI